MSEIVQLAPARSYEGSPLQWFHRKQREAAAIRDSHIEYQQALQAEYLLATADDRAAHAKAARASLVRFHAAKRRAAKLQRTPAWADMRAIRAIYARAQALTTVSGKPHHVDHVIPLQGEAVSGLHVETNLQILTGSENSRKRNRFEEA